jgi:hypothetical protein
MSGGSYGYFCYKMDDYIETLSGNLDNDPKRIAFYDLCKLLSKAMHDIEWVDSCDYTKGHEHPAIDAVLNFLGGNAETLSKAAAFDQIKQLTS